MYMKKIFLSFTVLLAFLLHTNTLASELILYSQDGFEIQTSSYIQDEQKYISLVKGSDLNITFTNNTNFSFGKNEPTASLQVYKKDTKDMVFSLTAPTKKMRPSNTVEFENYLKNNRVYFDNVTHSDNKVKITIPTKFEGGKYDVVLKLYDDSKKIDLNYSFTLADSVYQFTSSDILVEDMNVLAKIGYISSSEVEETNKVTLTLIQGSKELFKKEFDQKFYTEGSILIDEKIEALSKLTGKADLKIEIKDKNGKVILSQIKNVDLLKAGGKGMLYYLIIVLLLVLMVVLFVIFKNKRSKTFMMLLGLVFVGSLFTVFLLPQNTKAVVCGGNTGVTCCDSERKPASVCDQTTEYHKFMYKCEKQEKCATTDVRVRKYTSTGTVVNLAAPSQTAGPASVSINICNNISDTVAAGDKFYVISDTTGSNWSKYRYHIFTFTKGENRTITFPSTGPKRHVSSAVYNGSCGVAVSVEYQGDNTKFGGSDVTIIEAGKIKPDMCIARSLTDNIFEERGTLSARVMDRGVCTNADNGGLRNTYIAGSKFIQPISNPNSPWSDKTVNVCDLLGVTGVFPAGTDTRFYVVMEMENSWSMIRFPVFQFTFGKAFDRETYGRTHTEAQYSAFINKYIYYYDVNKEDTPEISYDGNCKVTFRLVRRGDDTDSNDTKYRMIELGMVENATCRDPILTMRSSYGLGKDDDVVNAVQRMTKVDADNTGPLTEGKYYYIAPFFYGRDGSIPVCKASTECPLNDSWKKVATDQTCNAPENGVCGSNLTSRNQCADGTASSTADTATNYNWVCLGTNGGAPSSQCSFLKPTVATNGLCSTTDANICTQGASAVEKTATSTGYSWKCPGVNGGATSSLCYVPVSSITTAVNGQCDQTIQNQCAKGQLIPSSVSSTTDDYVWQCSGTDGGAPSGQCQFPKDNTGTSIIPSVIMTKDPKVTLNKGGKCTISWDIQNIPAGGNCVLNGFGINSLGVTNQKSSKTISALLTNQKYVITCSWGTPAVTQIVKSVICRVNPNIIEN